LKYKRRETSKRLTHQVRRAWLVPLTVLAVCSYLWTLPSLLVGQELLRWKFQQGTVYEVTFRQQTTSKTGIADQAIEVQLTMIMQMNWKVMEVGADGNALMDQSFTRIRIELKNPQAEPVLYDSSVSKKLVGEAAQIATPLQPLIGKSFRVLMTSRGVVQKVELSHQMREALERVPEESRLKDVFTISGLTQTLQKSHGILPNQPVQPADRWESATPLVTPLGKLNLKTMYQYVGNMQRRDRAVAQIKVQGQLQRLPAEGQELPRRQVEIKAQAMSGELFFAKDEGRMLHSKMTQELTTAHQFRDLLLNSQMVSSLETTVAVIRKE